MYFDSIGDLIHMNGHGPYVWAVVAAAFVVVSVLAMLPALKKREFIRQELRLIRRGNANDTEGSE